MARQTSPIIPLTPEWEALRSKLLQRRARLAKLRVMALALFWTLSANLLLLLLVRTHNQMPVKDVASTDGVFILSPDSLDRKDYIVFVKWLDFNDPRKFYGVDYPQNYGNFWRPSVNRTELSEPYRFAAEPARNANGTEFRPLRMLPVSPQLAEQKLLTAAKTVNIPALLIYDQNNQLLYQGEISGRALVFDPTVLKKQNLRLSVVQSCGDPERDRLALRQAAAGNFPDGMLKIYWYRSTEVKE